MKIPFHWNVNPVLVSLGPLSFRWYGLFFALSFLIGYWIMSWMYRCENRSENELDRLLMVMVAGVIVGARLGHCLFYDPVWYLNHPMEILRIWEGGLAS
ncbi:MAG: prolipoprotein diacylglyceryl transferase family protein, partial [Desulfatirhabdiaceae bacterium]